MRLTICAMLLLAAALAAPAAEPSVAGRSLKEWIGDLDAKDALTREEALEVLPEFGSEAKPATPKLLKLYESDSPAVRYRAALALWRIDGRTEPALAVLTDALKTGGRTKRLQAVQLLMQLGRPAAELAPPVLELMLGEPDYNTQALVQGVLAQFGVEAAPAISEAIRKARGDQRIQLMTLVQNLGTEFSDVLPTVKEMAKEIDPRVRFAALRTIHALDRNNQDVLTELLQAGKSKDAGVRREAFQASLYVTSRPKELAPFYRDFLKDEDVTTRCRAAAVLYEIDPTTLKETLPVIRKELQEGNQNTWSMAAYSLGSFGTAAKEALPDLTNLLKRPEGRNYGYLVVQACRGIGPESVPLLLDVMEDPQAYYRSQAQQILVTMGPEAIPKLLPALQHKNPIIRQAMLDVMQRFGPGARSAVPTLANCLKDEDATVRDRTLSILENLGPEAKEAVPALREFVRNTKQDEPKRQRAMDALGSIGPEAIVAADIEPFLKDGNVLVRCRAAIALMRIDPKRRAELLPMFLAPLREKVATPGLTGAYLVQTLARFDVPPKEIIPGLLEFVKYQPADSQLQVAQGLNIHYSDSPETTVVFRELWKSPQVSVKQEAAIGLSRRKELPNEVVPFLAEQARISGKPARTRYFNALAAYGMLARSSVPALIDLWRGDTAIDARFRSAEAILQIEPEQPSVRTWVRDQFRTNAAVPQRQQAARVLAKVDPTFDWLRPTLQKWTKDGNVTTAAAGLEILGLLGEHGKTSVPLLHAAVKDSHPLKRARAAYSLWQIEKAPEAVAALATVLAEKDPMPVTYVNPGYVPVASRYGAQQAATALGEIGPAAKSAIPALKTAQTAPDEALRQAATAALKRIEGVK